MRCAHTPACFHSVSNHSNNNKVSRFERLHTSCGLARHTWFQDSGGMLNATLQAAQAVPAAVGKDGCALGGDEQQSVRAALSAAQQHSAQSAGPDPNESPTRQRTDKAEEASRGLTGSLPSGRQTRSSATPWSRTSWSSAMFLSCTWWNSWRRRLLGNRSPPDALCRNDCPFLLKSYSIQTLSWCSHCDPSDATEKRTWKRRVG